MKNDSIFWWLFLLFPVLLLSPAFGQDTYRVSGRVTDGTTGEGIPFASVAIQGTTAGTTSDIEGKYLLVSQFTGDSLLVSSVGYQTRAYRLAAVATQTVDMVLSAGANRLAEVKIYGKGGDPAYRIIREAVRQRDRFDPAQLSAYQYESYSKTEAYLNDFKKPSVKAGRKKRRSAWARLPAITGEDGQPAVPVFVSETASEFYVRSGPNRIKERVLKSRSVGVGITQGNLVAQLTGASFQQYNFYDNSVSLFRKDVPSPLGSFWETVYLFRLVDTVRLGNVVCYEVDFEPKQTKDVAFTGTVWIDTTAYGLAQVDVAIDKKANINFLDAIQLEQSWEDVTDSTGQTRRLPVETSLTLDVAKPSAGSPGIFVRFFLAAQNPVINQPLAPDFYEPGLELVEDYKKTTPAYWKDVRPATISREELRAFALVDSVRNTQPIRSIDRFIKLASIGYIPLGSTGLDIGPILYSYANNNVEGNRFRLGLRTNTDFSRRWRLNGYVAYGTLDKQIKYGVGAEYIIRRKPWTVVGWQRSDDLEQLGLNTALAGNAAFKAFNRFGNLRRPYQQENSFTYVRRELGGGFTQTVGLRRRSFEPLYDFAYQKLGQDELATQFRTTEINFETRFAPGSTTIQDNNERFKIGSTNQPVVTFRYDLGLKMMQGEFNYHRFSLSLDQSFRLGTLGRTTYQLSAGYMPSTAPYPLLFIPRGSRSIYRLGSAYNMMDFFEFALDHYAGLMVEHRFQGFLLNRVPLVRKLKWRLVVSGKILAGGVSETNRALTPATNEAGTPLPGFQTLGRAPYVELGYGVENVFKFLRIDGVHRLNYLDSPGATPFGIRLSTYIGF